MKYLLISLLLIPALAFSYTVVRKDGKKFVGTLVQETEDQIMIKDRDGVTIRFKKDQLDLTKTNLEPEKEKEHRAQPLSNREIEIRTIFPVKHQWVGEPISVDFKDIDIRDLFRFLAQTGNLNLIIDPQVKGTLTLKMTEVPWDQVLDVVCKQQGLGYTIDGNVVSVKK
jgi:type II secretory pathway component HofQ